MNDLCANIGYKSIKHAGEELCGDHVDVVNMEDGSTIMVLADGLGSGVKASILSTLTSKIISTINPHVILIRNGGVTDCPMTEIHIEGKKSYRSTIRLQEDDVFVAMSDGCPYASADVTYNNDWKREDIAQFMADMSMTGYTAKVLCMMLVDECDKLYGYSPRDDATACVIRIRRRVPMSILFEEATDINFYVGRAINPAHQNPNLPINFNIKMNIVEELSSCLRSMGKQIKVSYF